jgi:sugar phosphate isomerase/epimerase
VRLACHSLVFGALHATDALIEIARAGFERAVLAEIEGQAQHASQLPGVPLMPLVALDVAAHERGRVDSALEQANRLGISTIIVAPGGRPGGSGERSVPRMLAVTPRAGSAVWNVETAIRLVGRDPERWLWPDTSHLARAGDDLIGAARALAPHSIGWFIRDHDGRSPGPGSFESQVPGRGTLDLPGTIMALQDTGFDAPIVFHAVGHLPGGAPRPEYPLERLRSLAREARDYLERYCTSSTARPT